MIVIGLTGSIGMGKSTVSALFREMGVRVFDSDAAVHDLQGPGGALVAEIERLFPGTTTHEGVDRARLGAAVFGDRHALVQLEQLVHPAVGQQRRAFLRCNRARALVVLDIPLLFETNAARLVDVVVVVSAPAWMQRRRVLARPGMTRAKLRHILRVQTRDTVKRQRADYVIETARSLTQTRRRVRALVACIAAGKRR